MLQALVYPQVVAKQIQPNFRVRLPQNTRDDVTAWIERMGTTDQQIAERVLRWYTQLPEMLQLAIWRGWQVPPDSDMARAILDSLKPREADGGRTILSLSTPPSLTPNSLRVPPQPLPASTKGKSK